MTKMPPDDTARGPAHTTEQMIAGMREGFPAMRDRDMRTAEAIGRRLRAQRKALGLTQAQVGERAGIKQSYIAEIEAGTVNTTLDTLAKIGRALGLTSIDLPIPAA